MQNIGNIWIGLFSGLGVGVVSGVIATVFVYIVMDIWKLRIVPWYEERIYGDAKIEGIWKGKLVYSDSDISNFNFNIKQSAHRISGQMISIDHGGTYKIEGEFRNLILTLTYISDRPSAVDRGCFTFLLVKNGRELEGCGAFYYSPESRITTAPITLELRDNC